MSSPTTSAAGLGRIGLGPEATSMTTKTLRTRMLNMPGRMTTSGAEGPCTCRGHGRGRTSSTRSSQGCVPSSAGRLPYAPDPCATTASRPLCPAPADDGPPQPPSGPGLTRALCRLNGSSDTSTQLRFVLCWFSARKVDHQMSFGGSGLRALEEWLGQCTPRCGPPSSSQTESSGKALSRPR